MGLGLRRTSGPPVENWNLRMTRPLEDHDLRKAETTVKGVSVQPLQRLSERHHSLARDIASGMALNEAAYKNGLNPQRAYQLTDDPTFAALVKDYREKADILYVDAQEQLAGLSKDAILEIRERLETKPDEFSIGQLMKLTELTTDRTGNGPKTTTNINVSVGLADRLEQARRRVAERNLIDITPEGVL